MRIALIGAGITGVCTAFELACDGHDVTVLERRGSIAAEASFADSGHISPGLIAPWFGPGTVARLLQPAFGRPRARRLDSLSPALWPWLWRSWRAGRAEAQRTAREHLHHLAQASQERLHHLTLSLKLDYERHPGHLLLLRSAHELAQARALQDWLQAHGVTHSLLDAAQARDVEPSLNPDTPLQAALHLPGDEVANCRQFAHLLKAEAQRLGARFRFNEEVLRIDPGTPVRLQTRPSGDATDTALNGNTGLDELAQGFDAVVLCTGLDARSLLAPLGLHLPLVALHSHAVTAPLQVHEGALDTGPRGALTDAQHEVSISRLGNRVRVSGGFRLGGERSRPAAASLALLYKVLDEWFPGAARNSRALQWHGSRALSADGLPLLGASGLPGVWLNLAHGPHAWTLACGAARLVADQVAGRPSPPQAAGLAASRLR